MGAAKRSLQANDEDLRRFAAAFNRIDREVRQRAGMRRGVGTFREALDKAIAAGDPVVRRHQRRLRSIARLRNDVTHQDTADLWAPLPSRKAIVATKELADRIAGTSRNALAFSERTAGACLSNMTIRAFIDVSIEAAPVVDTNGKLCGAATISRLLRWVSSFEQAETSRLIANVCDDVPGTEWKLVDRDITVDQVVGMLTPASIELVVVTEHGRIGERPLGWFTTNDLPHLYEAL